MYDITPFVFTEYQVPSEITHYHLSTKEGVYLVPAQPILVWWKQQFHRIHPKHIGDGMVIVSSYPKRSIQIVPEALLWSRSLYQEYDESIDQRFSYLYKYSGTAQEIEQINTLVASHNLSPRLIRSGAFVRVDPSLLREPLVGITKTEDRRVSCLIGMCLARGKPKQVKDGCALSWHIGLPLVGSIAARSADIEQLWEQLAMQGIFVVRSMQSQKFGTLLQVTIHDDEVLSLLNHLRYNKQISLKNEITVAYKESFPERKYDQENSVLKFIRK